MWSQGALELSSAWGSPAQPPCPVLPHLPFMSCLSALVARVPDILSSMRRGWGTPEAEGLPPYLAPAPSTPRLPCVSSRAPAAAGVPSKA